MGNWNDPENDMTGLFNDEEDSGIKKYFEPKVNREKPVPTWMSTNPWANQQNKNNDDVYVQKKGGCIVQSYDRTLCLYAIC